jgi:hypothetical protein
MTNCNRINCIIITALTLSLITIACGLNINLPVSRIKTGPTQTLDIQLPLPEESTSGVVLNLEFPVGELKLSPGASGYLATGTATFNVADFEPKIETSGSAYTVRQGNFKVEGIPNIKDDIQNEWNLLLANTPMTLNIKAGAYTGVFELGGLSLETLAISDGGADLSGSFSKPNNVVMSSLTYSSGASRTELRGLANANFERMDFNVGAGDHTLSFDGELQRDASVMIDSGVSSLNIIVPKGVNANVVFADGLSTVTAFGGWEMNGDIYTLTGSGPNITITVRMGVGTVNLRTE